MQSPAVALQAPRPPIYGLSNGMMVSTIGGKGAATVEPMSWLISGLINAKSGLVNGLLQLATSDGIVVLNKNVPAK